MTWMRTHPPTRPPNHSTHPGMHAHMCSHNKKETCTIVIPMGYDPLCFWNHKQSLSVARMHTHKHTKLALTIITSSCNIALPHTKSLAASVVPIRLVRANDAWPGRLSWEWGVTAEIIRTSRGSVLGVWGGVSTSSERGSTCDFGGRRTNRWENGTSQSWQNPVGLWKVWFGAFCNITKNIYREDVTIPGLFLLKEKV